MGLTGKKKTHRVNVAIEVDMLEAKAENPTANPQGLLRNFVCVGGVPKWGTAYGAGGNYADLKALLKPGVGDTFTPNEPGLHTVILVYLEKGPDGKWRFRQVQTEEVHVIS
jgi:hypothetical protein